MVNLKQMLKESVKADNINISTQHSSDSVIRPPVSSPARLSPSS